MIFYSTIVVGSSLNAVLYAYAHRYPIFFTIPDTPFRFSHIPPDLDLSFLGMDNVRRVLKGLDGEMEVGVSERQIWNLLLFTLSMDGLSPTGMLCKSIRNEAGTATCSNEYGKILKFGFGECHYFGDDGSHGFVQTREPLQKQYLCHDWLAINRGGKIPYDYLQLKDRFVNHLWFYSSDRIDGDTGVKDVCVVSLLDESELQDFDFSPTMVRFKMIHELEQLGIRGPSAGLSPTGKPKYYKMRSTPMVRQLSPDYAPVLIPEARVVLVNEQRSHLWEQVTSRSKIPDTFVRFCHAHGRHNPDS